MVTHALMSVAGTVLLLCVLATPASAQALKTAAICAAEYQAEKAAVTAADEREEDFMASCQSAPVGTPTPIGGSAAPTPQPPPG